MHIPEALAAYRQFILHDALKTPCDPRTGRPFPRNSGWITDPQYWVDAATAVQAAAAHPGWGVGFVFTANDPFFFFDLDGALQPDGQWSELAQYMCQVFAGCYVEVSRSGTGLHIIGSGHAPPHSCKNTPLKIELYSRERYCALTGTHAQGTAAHAAQPQLEWLAANYFPPSAGATATPDDWTDGPCDEWSGPCDDDELIRKMLGSKGSAGAAFGGKASMRDLWEADADALGRCYPPQRDGQDFDHSSADAALCQHLAFWTGRDCERIDRLFRQSGLYRDKWDRVDYCRNTILHSIGHCTAVLGSRSMPTAPTPAAGDGPVSVSPQPIMALDPAGLRDGFQFLAVTQQQEHFDGCVYVREPHRVFTPDGSMLKPDQFKTTYGGYVFAIDLLNDKTTKSAWDAFTESQGYSFPKAHDACFRPELRSGEMIMEEGRILVNTYVPIETRRVQGDPSPFLWHLARMIPDPNDLAVLIAYMAALVQNPGVKFTWAPLIQGVKGNGKSLIGNVLAYCVGHRYTEIPDPNDISNKFNAWLARKLLIVVDEVYVGDRRDMENALKRLITGERIALQGKGDNQVTADNRANFMLNTNHKAAIRIDDDERRYAVFFTAQQEREHLVRDGMTGQYFPRLVEWLKADGYAIINEFLRTYAVPDALSPLKLDRAPRTSSTPEAISASLGGIEQEVLEAIGECRPGFAGGWISSLAFDKLLSDRHLAGKIPPTHRRELLRGLGYDWHPALKDGRTNNAIPCPACPGKPRLYIKGGHPAVGMTVVSEIQRIYLEAQSACTGAAVAFSPQAVGG